MANIDLAVGGSEAVINNLLKQLFPAVRSLLKQNIGIHQVNIASVDFEVTQPFQVDLQVRVKSRRRTVRVLICFTRLQLQLI